MPTAKKSDNQESSSGQVVPAIEWGKISSPQDARIALENAGIAVLNSSDVLGDGSEFIKDKDRLIGVPFLVLDWHFIRNDAGDIKYVNVLVMNATGEKARFNDGSKTGVCGQLKRIFEEYGSVIGISVKFGLRKSEYKTEDGEDAVTYYLSA